MILRLADFRFPDAASRLYPGRESGPWVLEIGFGDGRFWAEQGKVEPEANYLGVELSGVSLLKAARRLKTAGLPHAHLTRLPATTLLRGVIPPGGLDRIVVNFPDPWPKAGHEEHRLLRGDFFDLAASRLRPGGEVWITTDHDEYFGFACREADGSGHFEAREVAPPDAALRTKYALKWRELGLGVNHVRLVARHTPEVPGLDVLTPESETDMPHAALVLPPDLDLDDFRKTVVHAGEAIVVLLDAYRHPRTGGWAILAHVEEADLTQEALVSVTPRESGDALVRLERFGGVIVTPGLKAAVGAVTDLLEGRGANVRARAY